MKLWRLARRVLTQSPSGDDLAERSRAHSVLGQDAELVVCVGGQIRHVHLGARLEGHVHRVPALFPIITAHWNLLYPGEREAERRRENKRRKGNTESGFMKHDRKVGSINHLYSSSATEIEAETALMYDCNRAESLYLQLELFLCFKWSWWISACFIENKWHDPRLNQHLSPADTRTLKIINGGVMTRAFFRGFAVTGLVRLKLPRVRKQKQCFI